MQLDVSDLAEFYDLPIGQVARRAILRRLKLIWPTVAGERVLGVGFAVPYLRAWLGEAERVVAFMPAQQGVMPWPSSRNLTVLGNDDALPFADSLFDRILVVHGLEGVDAARPFLRQLWRVLAPEGRLLVVAPNRASLWAQLEFSPFGHGRPFHRLELASLLKSAMFEPVAWDRALLAPPIRARRLMGTGTAWERIGRRLWFTLAGVHLVEARKSLVAPLPQAVETRRERRLAPARATSPAHMATERDTHTVIEVF
jgi:SAM-dependent methyltransferase